MMYGGLLILAGAMLVAALILVLPLQLAAGAMGARRGGAGWCLLALLGASMVQALGLSVPVYGKVVAFLLSSAVFAGLLGTSFLRGMGIALLHGVFSLLLVVLAALLLGLSLGALAGV